MSLDAGRRLGPYEILGPIGAGGMGEVYRARDTRLQRQVAIKIVPAAVAGDPEALARFEREAQAVAALTHPNILAIHDFGRADGVSYAVMELLEGRTLADVLASGALPIRKAIDYAKQIADGLAAAHEKGIVHRDLKPANVFINNDGRVTILDFGLARVNGVSASENSATLAPETTPGMVVGTVGYMAPEQVRAQAIDYRTDVFAFGAVLYEMVSGRRAFSGTTPADTMSAILNADPPDLELGPFPPALDRIIRRCLEKEPGRRFQSTRDLGFALDSLSTRSDSSAAGVVTPASRSRLPLIATLCLLAGAAIGGLAAFMRPAPAARVSPPVVRFQIPSATGVPALVAISPDGESLAWGASLAGENGASILIRQLSQNSSTTIADSSSSIGIAWRGNGRQLLAGKNRQLLSVDAQTGLQTPFLDAPATPGLEALRGVAMGPDDQMLIGGGKAVFVATFGKGDKPKELARPEGDRYAWYGFPQWLPGGRMLYMALPQGEGSVEAFVRAISGGEAQRLDLPSETSRVLVDPGGYIVFARNGTLLGQRFDFTTLKSLGEPVTLGTDVVSDRAGFLAADLSRSGTLVYRSSSVALSRFEWVNRIGASTGQLGPEGSFTNFDLTADGVRVAALRRENAGPYGTSLWLIDGSRQTFSQLATGTAIRDSISDPTWSPDGQQLAYRRGNSVVVRNTFGGEERKIVDSRGYPDSWSKDGRYLALGRPNGTLFDLVAARIDGTAPEIPLTQGVIADEPRFSPDGKWVAYHAISANATHVYVIPFPPTGEKFQMSTTSGVQPRWRGDGGELFFLDLDGNMIGVEMPRSNPREAKPARILFRTGLEVSPINDQFAVSADGSRFLLRRNAGGSTQMPVNVILNWHELLK